MTTSWLDASCAWYNTHAQRFATAADALDPAADRAFFLGALDTPGPILDVGCGSGRDLRAFTAAGHTAIGWEPAPALADIARATTSVPVFPHSLDDLPESGPWAGIWAMAVLVHVPLADWSRHLAAMAQSLLPGGALCVVVKEGAFAGKDPHGRPFSAMPGLSLLDMVHHIPDMTWSLRRQEGPDSTGQRPVWLTLLGQRPHAPQPPAQDAP